ncbi:MAG: hypothetical protein PVI40_02065 [Chlamydiota bacterium]|jgi:hypothetical protein
MTARINTITFPSQETIINHLNSTVAATSQKLKSIQFNQIIAQAFANQTYSKDNIIKMVTYEFYGLETQEEDDSAPSSEFSKLIEIYSEALKSCPNLQINHHKNFNCIIL